MSYKINGTTVVDNGANASFDYVYYSGSIYGFNQATEYGYTLSGGSPSTYTTAVEKYSLTADANATDVGDVIVDRSASAGQQSYTHGYASGGYIGPLYANEIEKMPFASEGTGSDVGDLTTLKGSPGGTSSAEYGYVASGTTGGVPPFTSSIDRFPFASDTNATNIGSIVTARYDHTGISSTGYGYSAGGSNPADSNVIDRFPFSAPFATSSDMGDLTVAKRRVMGQGDASYGYVSGGHPGPSSPTAVNVVERFPFSSPFTTATDTGDLSLARSAGATSSSVVSGYTAGGNIVPSPVASTNVIDKFPFVGSWTTATDVGDLTTSRRGQSSAQK